MIFGINTWFLKEKKVTEALEMINGYGFEYAEIWMEHILKTGESTGVIRQKAEDLNMKLSLHATSYDINIASVNKGIRQESLKQVHEAIRTADKLGVKTVVVHPGRLSTKRMSEEDYYSLLDEALKQIDEWGGKYHIKIGLEAMEKKSLEVYVTPENVNNILSKGWNNIGLTLDMAHVYTFSDVQCFMDTLKHKDLIYHVHLSDGDEKNVHLPLGWGKHPIHHALEILSGYYDGLVAIEGSIPGKGAGVIKNNIEFLKNYGWILS